MKPVIEVACDLRPILGAVRDQGSRPTCLAFAASDAHAATRGDSAALSCEYAFYHAQRRAHFPITVGASLPHMLNAIRLDGQPLETDWPYLPQAPIDPTMWKPPAEIGALYGRKGTALPPTVEAVRNGLAGGRPVIALLKLSASFFAPADGGVVSSKLGEPYDTPIRHAVVAVAYGVVDGVSAMLIRNSWGVGWAIGGHAWLTDEYMEPRLFAAAILTDKVDVPAHSSAA